LSVQQHISMMRILSSIQPVITAQIDTNTARLKPVANNFLLYLLEKDP